MVLCGDLWRFVEICADDLHYLADTDDLVELPKMKASRPQKCENEHARIFAISKMRLQPLSRHGVGQNSHEFFADGSTRLLSDSKWA